jgi:UDP-MurNAc hydroxylase
MRIEFLGQACVTISDGNLEIVCDPWFSGPAHLDSWEPVPTPGASELARIHARIDRSSHLYVSHDHADHFDPAFLRSLAPKTLLCADFRNRRFREALQATGHRVRALQPGETYVLGRHELRIIPEQPRYRTNSMLLVRSAVGCVLNGNDCGLNTSTLQAIGGRERVRVFLYTLNFMANGYPFPYLRSDDPQLVTRVAEVRDQMMELFDVARRALQPELSVAFAGPVTFADQVNHHLNRHPEALDWSAMVEALCAGGDVWWPTPGAAIVLAERSTRLEGQSSWPQLIEAHLGRPAAPALAPDAMPSEAAIRAAGKRFLERVGASLSQAPRTVGTLLVLSGVDALEQLERGPLRFSLQLDLDVRSAKLEPHDRDAGARPPAPFLWIVATHRALLGFLDGRITLDDLLLSARARFVRDPDTFNATLHDLLRFGHDPESLAEVTRLHTRRSGRRAELELEVGHERFSIPKFCPHEGESLELATVCGHELTCPRHKWVFDLRTGACIRIGDPNTNLYAEQKPEPDV